MEEGRGEGKIGAERLEFSDEFMGAAVGVQEESLCRELRSGEDVPEVAPRAEAMDGNRSLETGGQIELRFKSADLGGKIMRLDPAVQSNLSDSGVRMGMEKAG